MSLHIKANSLWKEASVLVRAGGVWKEAEAYVRQGGLWYQSSANGLSLIIDSPTTLYDFNLKNYLIGAGLWPASGPVVIKSLTITARTVITQSVDADVPDGETVYNGTSPKRTWRGYKTIVLPHGGGVYAHYHYQEDQALYPAFTTGSGWPAGSHIGVFTVEGTIYGRGADGAGLCKTYTASNQLVTNGNVVTNPPTFYNIAGLINGKTLRHGWHGMELTLPVNTLDASGLIAGGGAAATRWGLDLKKVGVSEQGVAHPVPLRDWPTRLTQDFLVNQPRYLESGGGYLYGFVHGVLLPATLPSLVSVHPSGFNGLGGGQGGGIGGKGVAEVPLMSLGSYSHLPVDGGDGSLQAVGVGSNNLVRFTGSDAKSQYFSTLGQGQVFSGASFGTKPMGGAFLYGDGAPPPTSPTYNATLWDEGVYPTRGLETVSETRVFASQAGHAIRGSSNITTIINPANIKGDKV